MATLPKWTDELPMSSNPSSVENPQYLKILLQEQQAA